MERCRWIVMYHVLTFVCSIGSFHMIISMIKGSDGQIDTITTPLIQCRRRGRRRGRDGGGGGRGRGSGGARGCLMFIQRWIYLLIIGLWM